MNELCLAIEKLKNPTVMGLDTRHDYLPPGWTGTGGGFEEAAEGILKFNMGLIDALEGVVPAVKIQIAYYEMYGLPGMRAYAKTAEYAKRRGFIVMTDAKRGDIGATAGAYAAAYLGRTVIDETALSAFPSDILTVNPYFGSEGVQPFVDACKTFDKGIFVLVKTSNPTSGELQDLILADGRTVYECVADLVQSWGADCIGDSGFSRVGAVVGATYPEQAKKLRERLNSTFFLVPGYGAQGAGAKDIAPCFVNGRGAIVNASRSLMLAYRNKAYAGMDYQQAAYAEAIRMRDEIMSVL